MTPRLGFLAAIGVAMLFAAIGPSHAQALGWRVWPAADTRVVHAPPVEREPLRRSAAIDGASGVLAFAARFLGQGDPTHLGLPWCKSFANFVLRHTGHRAGPSLMAIDAMREGVRVSSPKPGDLAVMRGHVTFFVAYDGRGGFVGLGGNQHHIVKYSRFELANVLSWVRPT